MIGHISYFFIAHLISITFQKHIHVIYCVFQIFIRKYQQTEGPRVLKSAILNPAIIDILSEVVTPSTTNSQCFIKMYQTLIESYMECSEPKIMSTLLAKVRILIVLSFFSCFLNKLNQTLI